VITSAGKIPAMHSSMLTVRHEDRTRAKYFPAADGRELPRPGPRTSGHSVPLIGLRLRWAMGESPASVGTALTYW
jgi:hypothetical protein